MQLDIVVVMDPIDGIKPAKDTTFAMLLEGQRRGHRLLYVRPGGLSLRDGRASARVAPLEVRDDAAEWFSLGEFADIEFGPGQAVLMRTDPPVSVPIATGTRPAATATPAPEEEPPGVCAGSCGLVVAPGVT